MLNRYMKISDTKLHLVYSVSDTIDFVMSFKVGNIAQSTDLLAHYKH